MTGKPVRATCCDEDGECFGDGTDAWCCDIDQSFFCSSNLQLYAENTSTKKAVLCNYDERVEIRSNYTVAILSAVIVFLLGVIAATCVYKSNERKKRRKIAADLAAHDAKQKKVESSSESSSEVSSDTVSDSSDENLDDTKTPANANSNKIETEEQRAKREHREEQKRKRLLKLNQMKRKQSVIHDKLDLQAGNIELA